MHLSSASTGPRFLLVYIALTGYSDYFVGVPKLCGCDRDNVDITVITSSSFISALTADNTAACDKVCRSANRRLINHDVALNDASGGLAFRSSSRFAIPDEKTHLLIKVMASNFSVEDAMNMKMKSSGISIHPYVPGELVIGTIEGIGSEVDSIFFDVELGDRVMGMVHGGGCSCFLSAEADNFVKAPTSSGMSNTAALALMHDWVPAYRALSVAKNAMSGASLFGMNILLTDAISAAGQAAIALASEEGANIYCCAEKTHHEYLKSLGSRITCVDLQPNSWLPELKEKMHIVIDNTCMDGYASSWEALGRDGFLICLPSNSLNDDKLFGLFDEDFKAFNVNKDESSAEKRVNFIRDFQYLAFLHEKVAGRSGYNLFKYGVRGTGGTRVCLPWKNEA
eukprot:scaffold11528_cov139-Skeletonema_marinoi.AAC.2